MIGFGAHTGTVACASDLDGPMEIKQINPSRPDSYERLAHDSGVARFLLDLRQINHESLRYRLLEPKLERFIGVIYRPETERWSHYSAARCPSSSTPMSGSTRRRPSPLPTRQREGAEETYPFGL